MDFVVSGVRASGSPGAGEGRQGFSVELGLPRVAVGTGWALIAVTQSSLRLGISLNR